MSLGKKLFIGGGGGTCFTDSVQPFGAESAYSSNVALYQLDSDGGTTNNVPDTVGNYNGTASNVTYSTGKFGNAAVFNGSSSSIDLGNNFNLTQGQGFTISMWVNPDSVSSNFSLISKDNSTNRNWTFSSFTGSESTPRFFIKDTSNNQIDQEFTSQLSAGTWSHLVVTWNGGLNATDIKLYFDGNLEPDNQSGSATISNVATNTQSTLIGDSGNYGNHFDGKIDQVRLYDKALSSDEVGVLYNETASTASDTNVLGEGSGLALYSLDYDASDAGGNYNSTPTDVTFGVDGQINYGASFNGSSSEIEFTTDSNFVNDFSISAWINMNQLPASAYLYQVVAWGDEATGERRSLGIWNGGSGDPKVYFSGFGSAANFGGSTSVSANEWYHVCVTRSGSTVKVYLDGDLDGTGTVTLNSYTGTTGRIGNSASANEHFNGTIDQVRIFSKALSSSEVSTLYTETACVYTSTTDIVNYQGTNLAYYKLDNTAKDETGNYDGTESNITYEFGRYGQAAVFNDSAITTSLNIGRANDFTISLWVKDISDSNYGSYGFKWVAGVYNNDYVPIDYNITTSKIRFSVHDGTTALGSLETPALDDNWHHIVVTQDVNVETKLYVDGVLQTSETVSHTSMTQRRSVSGGSGFYLAQNPANSSNDLRYRGKIDQVRIYNSALDATAVENLYNEKPETDTSNFNAVLYEGNGSSQYISNVGFQPDLVWVKKRDGVHDHKLADSVRGATKILESSTTDAEITATGSINAFEANGFNLGSDSSVNGNGNDFVAWCWKGGGDAVSNTVGDITSQVSANQDAGFSIVEYTGNLSAATTATGESVGHGLSSPPELIIFKNTSNVTQWNIFSSELDNWSTRLQFDTSQKNDLYSQYPIADPTSSVFYTNYLSSQNVSGSTHIAYCFHSVTGYQKIGSYTGTGGTSVNTISFGFAPAFVLIKRTNTTGGWRMFDSTRDTGTRPLRINHSLRANLGGQEYDGTNDPNGYMSFTNDGISFSTTEVNGDLNANGSTYVYLAIA